MIASDTTEPSLGRFVMTAECTNGQRISVECSAETGFSDMLDAVETYLIAIGFDPGRVREALK